MAQNVWNPPHSACLKPQAFWKPDSVVCAGTIEPAASRNWELFEPQDCCVLLFVKGPW